MAAYRAWALALLALAVFPAPVTAQGEATRERVAELRALALSDSLNPSVHYALGLALLSRRQYLAADSAFAEATAVDPQFAQGFLGRGVSGLADQRALEQLRRRGPEPLMNERVRRLNFIRRAFLIDPFLDIRLLVTQPYLVMWPGLERQLAYEVRHHGSMDSVPPGLLWIHSLVAARTLHLREAMADVEALLRVSRSHEADDSAHVVPLRTNEFRYMLAWLYQRAGEDAEAVRLYREALAHDIGLYMAHAQLARIHEAAANWDEAIAERRRAIDVHPEDQSLQLDLAVTLGRSGRWPEAEEVLLRTRTLAPRDSRVVYRLGIAQQMLGKTAEARANLSLYLMIAPRGAYAATPRDDATRRLEALGAAP